MNVSRDLESNRVGTATHLSDYDAKRSEVLERLGLRAIRFANEEVCADLDLVLARIR